MKSTFFLTSALALMLIPTARAAACGCGTSASTTPEEVAAKIRKAFEGAAVVFSGRVVAAEYRPDAIKRPDPEGAKALTYRFKIETWWKGGDSKEIILYTTQLRFADGSGGGSNCDYDFKVGKSYLVYGYRYHHRLVTNQCSRTGHLEKVGAEIVELEKIKAETGQE